MNDDAVRGIRQYVETARWFGGKGRDFTRGRRTPGRGARRRSRRRLPRRRHRAAHAAVRRRRPTRRETYQVPLAYYDRGAGAARARARRLLGRRRRSEPCTPTTRCTTARRRRCGCSAFDAAARARDEGRRPDVPPAARSRPRPGARTRRCSPASRATPRSRSATTPDEGVPQGRRPGRNPDIVIHRALTEQGSEHVAALYGWLELEVAADEPVQLAMLQQFLRTASDGWDLALASVRDLFAEADLHADEVGGDFAGEAERLGLATAEVHDALAERFPTETWDAERAGRAVRGDAGPAGGRAGGRCPSSPSTPTRCARPSATWRSWATPVRSATAQRVHGDFHLGQTLRTVKGWKIVDFEGEPAKPLAERVLPGPGVARRRRHAAVVRLRRARGDRRLPGRRGQRTGRSRSARPSGPTATRRRSCAATSRPAGARPATGCRPEQDSCCARTSPTRRSTRRSTRRATGPTWLPIPLGRDRPAHPRSRRPRPGGAA